LLTIYQASKARKKDKLFKPLLSTTLMVEEETKPEEPEEKPKEEEKAAGEGEGAVKKKAEELEETGK